MMTEEGGGGPTDSNRDPNATSNDPNMALDDRTDGDGLVIANAMGDATAPEEEVFILPMSTKSSLDGGSSIGDVDDDDMDEDVNTDLLAPLVAKDDSNIDDAIRSRRRGSEETGASPSNTNLTPVLSNTSSNCSNSNNTHSGNNTFPTAATTVRRKERIRQCCSHANEIRRNILRNTITFMNFLARLLFWVSLVVTALGVIWYSKELAQHG